MQGQVATKDIRRNGIDFFFFAIWEEVSLLSTSYIWEYLLATTCDFNLAMIPFELSSVMHMHL